MYSNTRVLNPTVAGTAVGYSDLVAINNAESVGFGVDWPVGITEGAYTLEFVPTKPYAGTGSTVIGPFTAPTAAQYDSEAVGVAGRFCRIRRTVALVGTGTPVLYLFIRQ